MTKGRIALIQKHKSKGNEANNYHPITCLPLTWKLLTGVIVRVNLWFSREGRDITRRAEKMQNEGKGYWGLLIHR